ncbi:hypothetical protein F5141DRAFT_1118202, partial [Pisolithus sp. B1]
KPPSVRFCLSFAFTPPPPLLFYCSLGLGISVCVRASPVTGFGRRHQVSRGRWVCRNQYGFRAQGLSETVFIRHAPPD